jgi:hypothetical protein
LYSKTIFSRKYKYTNKIIIAFYSCIRGKKNKNTSQRLCALAVIKQKQWQTLKTN